MSKKPVSTYERLMQDRDINAAINIKAAGLAVLACGEAIRPGRARAKAKAQLGTLRRSRNSIGASL